MPEHTGDIDAWVDVLDEMERRLEHGPDAGGWDAPRSLRPLPDSLRPRAERLLVEQRRAVTRVIDELARVRAELRAIRPRELRRPDVTPVYLDVTG